MNPISPYLAPKTRQKRSMLAVTRQMVDTFGKHGLSRVIAWPLVVVLWTLVAPFAPLLRARGRRDEVAYRQLLFRAATLWDGGRQDEAVRVMREVYEAGVKAGPPSFSVEVNGKFRGMGHFELEEALCDCETALQHWDAVIGIADRWLSAAPSPYWVAKKAHALMCLRKAEDAVAVVRKHATVLRDNARLAEYCTKLVGQEDGAITPVDRGA